MGAGEGEKTSEYFTDFYEFDSETGWKQISDIARARVRATAFVANGYGYVCLGVGADDIQKFDPKSNTWKGQPICYERERMPKYHQILFLSCWIKTDGILYT